jgi:hypothetical protein
MWVSVSMAQKRLKWLLISANILKPFPSNSGISTNKSKTGGLEKNATTSSHQTLAAALSAVVTSSFEGPGQYGGWRRRASITFLASIHVSLSVIGLITRSEGLSLIASFRVDYRCPTLAGVMAGTNNAAAASDVEGTANGMTGLVKTTGGRVDTEKPKDVGRTVIGYGIMARNIAC